MKEIILISSTLLFLVLFPFPVSAQPDKFVSSKVDKVVIKMKGITEMPGEHLGNNNIKDIVIEKYAPQAEAVCMEQDKIIARQSKTISEQNALIEEMKAMISSLLQER